VWCVCGNFSKTLFREADKPVSEGGENVVYLRGRKKKRRTRAKASKHMGQSKESGEGFQQQAGDKKKLLHLERGFSEPKGVWLSPRPCRSISPGLESFTHLIFSTNNKRQRDALHRHNVISLQGEKKACHQFQPGQTLSTSCLSR